MEKQQFDAFYPIKIQDVISVIIQKDKITFEKSLELLYNSILYTHLENEKSKLWRFSSEKIYSLLKEEKRTNQFVFPDYI